VERREGHGALGERSVGAQEHEECEECEQNARGKTPARDYVRTASAPPQPNLVMSQTVHPCRIRRANESRAARACIARMRMRVGAA
jgi:hypothetical protein